MMKKILTCLVLLSLFFTACHKDKSPETTPAPGTTSTTANVSGTISPADAVVNVTIVDASGKSYTAKPDAGGAYKFSDLPAGTYTVWFAVATGYATISSKFLTITAGQNVDMGSIFFTAAAPGSLSGTIAPAGTVTKITATNTVTKDIYAVTPDALSGAYKFNSLAAGSYLVSFTAAAPSVAPADISVTIPAGQSITLNTIVVKTPGVTSSVSGMIAPAGTATVTITNTQNYLTYIAYPDLLTGNFTSPALLPGTYSIKFNADRDHTAPANQSVTLTAGQNLDLGTITFKPYFHLISCLINDKLYTGVTVVSGSYAAHDLRVGASNSKVSGDTEKLEITLDAVNGPGMYNCQGTPTSRILYSTGSFGLQVWSTINSGGSGSVVITDIDPILKVITGTFTATLVPFSSTATGTLVIKNGVFKMTYY